MSAYLVNPEHIAYLAQFWKKHNKHDDRTAHDAAELLALANVTSIEARYGKGAAAEMWGASAANYIIESATAADSRSWASFTAAQVMKAALCFEYQACEVDHWERTPACAVVNDILRSAARSVPGYDIAPYGAPDPLPGSTVLLSSLVPKKPAPTNVPSARTPVALFSQPPRNAAPAAQDAPQSTPAPEPVPMSRPAPECAATRKPAASASIWAALKS